MKLSDFDFSSLDPHEIGMWPLPLRILVALVACCITIAAVHFLYLASRIEGLHTQQKQEQGKRDEFKDKYSKAINLSAYEQQMDEINAQYNAQLTQMPRVGNVPELLNFITKLAAKNGLKIESIRLGEAIPVEGFYENMQLDLALIGTYHSMGRFLADLSKLSRIVTLHNFTVKPHQEGGVNTDLLYLTIVTKTYWLTREDTSKKQEEPKPNGSATKNEVEVEEIPEGAQPRTRPGAPRETE